MKSSRLAVVALVLLIPLASAGVSAAPKSDHAIAESQKKPGQTCDSLAHGSAAYKQCIQTQAHSGQSNNGKGKGQSKKP